MKDHQIAAFVNQLRDIAVAFHGSQQLRECISSAVHTALKADTTPQPTTQFEAWAKIHHYDLVRCSHEPYAAYRSDLTNAARAAWRGANGESSAAQAAAQDGAENFACYLIDNCENEIIREESVQVWLGRMLKSPQYASATAPQARSVFADEDDWYERLQDECTRDRGEYPEGGTLSERLRWWVPKSVRHGSTTLEDDLREAADSLNATPPQATVQVISPVCPHPCRYAHSIDYTQIAAPKEGS